jgi:hypothetical protein
MKFWKSLLEQDYFGVVLIGQDTMPLFISEYPNEFQIAENIRISYLAPEDAKKLIVDPIRIPETQESRYKGNALNTLVKLTAGSPFYIQIFCNRLVRHMNNSKTKYVTDADIQTIKDQLTEIDSAESLTDNEFDNLINAGDKDKDIYTTGISSEDTWKLLYNIAKNSRLETYCQRSSIARDIDLSSSLDDILNDLVRREVIEQSGDSYRIRIELFKEWLIKRL